MSALVVLAVVYVGVRVLFPEEEPVVEEEEGGQYDYLVQYDASEIAAMKFEFADGYEYEVTFSRSIADSGYTETQYLVTGKTEYEYDSIAFSSLLSATVSITSATTAVEAPDDLGVYGLENPRYVSPTRIWRAFRQYCSSAIMRRSARVTMPCWRAETRFMWSAPITAEYLLYKDMYYRNLSVTSYTDVVSEVDSVRIVRRDGELYVRRQTEERTRGKGYFCDGFPDQGTRRYRL